MKNIPEGYKETELGVIPKEWEVKKLGEIAEICYGKNQKAVEVVDGIYKILGTGGVIGKTNSFLWDKPSVLIGRKGTINKPIYIEEPFWTVDTLFFTKIKKIVVAKWLYYYLNKIDLAKFNEASGVPSLNTKTLNNIFIPVPPLPEQEKIAEILSSFDEHIEKLDDTIKEYGLLKKGMMKKLLTKGINHTEFKETELGIIPKEWEVKKLGEIAEIKRGASPRPINDPKWFDASSKVGWIRISDVTKSKKYLEKTEQYLSIEGINKSRLVHKGEVIMSICASIGEPVILNIDACIHDGFVVYSNLDKTICTNYLYFYISSIKNTFKTKGQIGTQSNINTELVNNTNIPVPPLPEQEKIAEILSSIDERIDLFTTQKEEFVKIKKGLMEKLLTGKIRVNELY